MDEKSIPLNATNVAIQRAADKHILPNVIDHSILFMGWFCDTGWRVTFTSKEALIILNREVVLWVIRHKNGLWYLDTKAFKANHQAEPPQQSQSHHQCQYNKMPQTCDSIHACSPLSSPSKLPSCCHQSGIPLLLALTQRSQRSKISDRNASNTQRTFLSHSAVDQCIHVINLDS